MKTFYGVVHITKRASLFAIAPNFNFVVSGEFSRGNFAAERGWCFFASAIPGALWTENVVETCNASL